MQARVDGDRADCPNRVALAQEIETGDPPLAAQFSNQRKHRRIGDECPEAARCDLDRRKNRRIAVPVGHDSKALVADAAASFRVGVRGGPNRNLHYVPHWPD